MRKFKKPTDYLLSLIFFLIFSSAFGQANTIVMCKVKNHNPLVKKAELHINARYINNTVDIYESKVLEDGSFAFAVEVYEPQYVTVSYSRNKALVYLEPNDTLYIDSEAGSFQFSIEFSGKGGHNNKYLRQYLKEHPKELNQFKMLQYKHGNYWFTCSPQVSEHMQRTPWSFYQKDLALKKQQSLDALSFYDANNPNQLSSYFKDFLKTEIEYDWAYKMLLYGTVFKNKHQIPDDFMTFLNEIAIQNEHIGNYRYREFTMAHLSYQTNKSKNSPLNQYILQYDLAKQSLSGRTQSYALSEVIFRGFNSTVIDELIPYYWEYMDNSANDEFDDKVLAAYQKAMKQVAGSPAPPFKLYDNLDRIVTLQSYNGQVVFLNFWASWCRPCMSKMQMMQPIQEELKELGVVFMNVSLDRDKDAWKRAIDDWNFKGVHLLAEGNIDSEVALAYEVKLLPEYFIINKNGTFAEKPKKFTAKEVTEVLNNLRK